METTTAIDFDQVAQELGLRTAQVSTVVDLMDEGNTVPFITRYRKDRTGGLDEEQIRQIEERVGRLRLLAERKHTILRSIDAQGKLTPELHKQIIEADSVKRVEDLYVPYKPKRQTLATLARDRGLEPLADEIFEQKVTAEDFLTRAADFVNTDRKVPTPADALLGAGHILAERYAEEAEFRGKLRDIIERTGYIVTNFIRKEADKDAENKDGDKKPAKQPEPQEDNSENKANDAPAESTTEASTTEEHPAAAQTSEPAPADPPTAAAVASEQPPAETATAEAIEATAAEPSAETQVETQAATPGAEAAAPEPPPVEGTVAEVQAPAEAPAQSTTEQTTEESATAPTSEAATSEATEPAAEPTAEQPAEAAPAKKKSKKDKTAPSAKSQRKQQAPMSKAERIAKEKQTKLEHAFRDFADFREKLSQLPPHRTLAINRGERAKILRVKIEADQDQLLAQAVKLVPEDHVHADFLRGCAVDALNRLVIPSLERDVRRELTEKAEAHAVQVFARNLRNLLLQPPVRNERVLAIDPGLRTGCKYVALDAFGSVLGHGVLHLVGKAERYETAKQQLLEAVEKYESSVVAIGNGSGCRDAERLVADVIKNLPEGRTLKYVVVNEAGASVYSTSNVAREELPEFDATLRGAVSIGRRLLDPLSELVKIEPANIGVGMYQHDLRAKHLRSSLDSVVESCVNYVGVDVNTASPSLLRYVSGLNQLTARRVFEFRQQHGPFHSREELKQVPGFGESAFVQAAGFLKIAASEGNNPLDRTWIHPESYDISNRVLERIGCSLGDIGEIKPGGEVDQRIRGVKVPDTAKELGVGEMLLGDILQQLVRPGRDPREGLSPPMFRQEILTIDDLEPGMQLTGSVLNVVDFGAFVDIGLKDSGLVHLSQLTNRYIRDPHEVAAVGDIVHVWVLSVDKQRRRVSLTMIDPALPVERPARERPSREKPAREKSQRPQRKGRGRKPGGRETAGKGGGGRPQSKRVHTRPPAKPKPAKPITKAMAEGKEPLRSFGDLKQFFEQPKKKSGDDTSKS